MNIENILDLIQDKTVKNPIKKILEFEQSRLHQSQPIYKEHYKMILQEALRANSKNQVS